MPSTLTLTSTSTKLRGRIASLSIDLVSRLLPHLRPPHRPLVERCAFGGARRLARAVPGRTLIERSALGGARRLARIHGSIAWPLHGGLRSKAREPPGGDQRSSRSPPNASSTRSTAWRRRRIRLAHAERASSRPSPAPPTETLPRTAGSS